jgi:tetratricopeptide (TPR) repeat protein
MSPADTRDTEVELERAIAFARMALDRKLVTKEYAEECVKIARDALARRKTLAIDEIFVRKGYLRRPEAQAVLRALNREPRLDPDPEGGDVSGRGALKRRRICRNCERDAGQLPGECERCGTDLATGGPGPHATICTTCSLVVKRGAAVCPRCATSLARDHHRKFDRKTTNTAGAWVDRVILVLALVGGVYFLAFRGSSAPPPEQPPEPKAPSALKTAEDAVAKGQQDMALHALEAAAQEPDHSPDLDVALALAYRRAGRTAEARGALAKARQARPQDQALVVLSAALALDANAPEEAEKLLAPVPPAAQGDDFFRAEAGLADAQKDESGALAALEKLKVRTPAEGRRLAQAALSLGDTAFDADRLDVAFQQCESAVALAPDYVPAHERRGLVLLKLGKAPAARQSFERAVDLAPREAAPKLGLAIACDAAGDRPAAVKAFKEFLAIAGNDPRLDQEVARVKKRLSAIAPGE